MDKRIKKTKVKVTEIIDVGTGEIINTQHESLSINTEPDFVKLYLKDIAVLHNLSFSGNRTLLALLPKMNYDNQIILATKIKEEIANNMGIKKNTLEHSIAELVTKGVLLKEGNNYYVINPYLLSKGTWKDISKIRLTISYDKVLGRQVRSEFQKELPFPNDSPLSMINAFIVDKETKK